VAFAGSHGCRNPDPVAVPDDPIVLSGELDDGRDMLHLILKIV
jgi:hypothetical protein